MMNHNPGLSSNVIYEDLCAKIEKLEYMPGDRLSENELCRLYGVTRHVIRNALVLLKQRRLVEVYPQRGTYVSLIDMQYISDILFMREAAEQEAIARIIEKGDQKDLIQRLKMAVEAQSEIVKEENYYEKFYTVDSLFHNALFEAIAMPNVMNLIADSYIHIRRWRNFEIRSQERLQEIITEHESILQALEQDDLLKARRIMHLHLDTVTRYSTTLREKEAQYFVSD
ncbi:MAG: GntR family transcriptional regulator [Lachnospiraceae bacterium]